MSLCIYCSREIIRLYCYRSDYSPTLPSASTCVFHHSLRPLFNNREHEQTILRPRITNCFRLFFLFCPYIHYCIKPISVMSAFPPRVPACSQSFLDGSSSCHGLPAFTTFLSLCTEMRVFFSSSAHCKIITVNRPKAPRCIGGQVSRVDVGGGLPECEATLRWEFFEKSCLGFLYVWKQRDFCCTRASCVGERRDGKKKVWSPWPWFHVRQRSDHPLNRRDRCL